MPLPPIEHDSSSAETWARFQQGRHRGGWLPGGAPTWSYCTGSPRVVERLKELCGVGDERERVGMKRTG